MYLGSTTKLQSRKKQTTSSNGERIFKMKNYTQQELLAVLRSESSLLEFSNNKDERYKGRLGNELADLIEGIDLMYYNNIKKGTKTSLNYGDIVENMLLYVKDLECENEKFEIKSLIKSTANILINNNTKWVYVLVLKAENKGIFKVNAEEVRNKRLTGVELFACPSIKPVKYLSKAVGFKNIMVDKKIICTL